MAIPRFLPTRPDSSENRPILPSEGTGLHRARRSVTILLASLLGLALAACISGLPEEAASSQQEGKGGMASTDETPTSSESASPHHRIELALERAPERDEAVHVRVSAGVLPDGAEIAVRLPDGELIGTVSPYGVPEGRKAGIYSMALPRDRAEKGPVALHFQLVTGGQEPRAPTGDELEGAELIFVGIEPPVEE